ncbi:hypothetical protein DPMN_025604 [Dreissena polymorpha]|uniref:Uncharacterized protein n=1 Tax=Dreissena polymorpha TaxID=45954 RepID=A0A9D4RC00_DREPO|nr:hypothetical protein DPMN_025604 [Dreissena polymorpha]
MGIHSRLRNRQRSKLCGDAACDGKRSCVPRRSRKRVTYFKRKGRTLTLLTLRCGRKWN